MQLPMANNNARCFQMYLNKTFRKTASLVANSCKAIALLATPKLSNGVVEISFEFGRHLGMAFQLIDDVLNFVGNHQDLGKPAKGSDMELGIATGPVLFAAQRVNY
ncbi:unnamed protein product [Protopolystoma xenopodis]|uniref:Polyprenyl synthetase n=1 Tax=Protopolystoma xenopodis TaxID=117903 RepID=A0A448XA14_9PLAT|nr:unnamed protein product [Protopolystoma xenopodis]